ncbi:iron-sulfur cluster repair di-iron protein [Haoranjiania flava]|uniref:Iron-sulfur cluster repair di-iron protein n=1 Tax=Haoranjiania flava TaxID=1856322 RepID=A0AAE3LM95_9BACT|nr:iron-sulfur cluster repair di-iron protein [Haoranjiania flava]MCU7693611.1 iron-sulfur cluster repair di-iron protein [Haoranjiania flava]
MENILEQNIGQLVAKDYRAAAVFKKNKIDFCCNGNRTINEAADAKKLDKQKLAHELQEVLSANTSAEVDVNGWPLDLLADYVTKKHHRYIREKVPVLLQFLDKLCRVHGERHPELFEINNLFRASAEDLEMHLQKEEHVLFPFIEEMVAAGSQNHSVNIPFGTVENPVSMMMDEHNVEGERFRKIAELTNEFNPPADACNTYRVAFAMLKEFEEDLHRHIHLENNILFPKAIALEKIINHGAN